MTLPLDTYIAALRHEGDLYAAAIEASGADAPIPTCPGWRMRDLVHHTGEVHRWATTIVTGALVKPSLVPADHVGPLPADDRLVTWFTEGHNRLVEVLTGSPQDLSAFVFLADPPPPLLFWARRQTHETAMHRVDAESASGCSTPIAAEVAADGIDEMLTGFAPRKHTPLHADPPVSMLVTVDGVAAAWHLTIGGGPPAAERVIRPVEADCSVTGSADAVHRALWNRCGTDELDISGDADVLQLFRDNVRISW